MSAESLSSIPLQPGVHRYKTLWQAGTNDPKVQIRAQSRKAIPESSNLVIQLHLRFVFSLLLLVLLVKVAHPSHLHRVLLCGFCLGPRPSPDTLNLKLLNHKLETLNHHPISSGQGSSSSVPLPPFFPPSLLVFSAVNCDARAEQARGERRRRRKRRGDSGEGTASTGRLANSSLSSPPHTLNPKPLTRNPERDKKAVVKGQQTPPFPPSKPKP
jgi:hypothetical protein